MPPPKKMSITATRSSWLITCLVLFVFVFAQLSHQPFNYDHQQYYNNSELLQQKQNAVASPNINIIKHIHPLIPRLSESIINEPDGKALAEFYKTQACPQSSGGGGIDADSACIMDLLSDTSSTELQARITNLRRLAKSIMNSKNITCGHPKILGKESLSTDMEFCFWNNDFVSNEAMNDFAFEASDWQWVVRMFNNLHDVVKEQDYDHNCLAFLDAGVNVGDWATPITGSLPNVAYFGIEGSPPTAAISSANMLSVVHNQKYGEHNITNLAPRALVPFPVMSEHSFMGAKQHGGVCFNQFADNIGGQGITNTGAALHCEAKSTAGAAYFPSVLLNLARTFQPNCVQTNQTKTSQHWPSVYIAKFDIQGFEFQALAPAIVWLEERPPCYIMLEFCNHERQNYALMQLLVNVVGYDAVWRNSIFQDATVYEQPPQAPHWTKSDGTELWTVYEKDMEGKVDWSYINYIFGFVDQEACVKRLLG